MEVCRDRFRTLPILLKQGPAQKSTASGGRYLLRTNLVGHDPAEMWQFYTQLVHVEEAFKNLKGDLALRPIHHQEERRIEAHIFVAFMAYALQVTLRTRLCDLAPGLTPRAALEKFSTVQMIDVYLPTTDGRTVIMSRYTQPDSDLKVLLAQLRLSFPGQPPPRMVPKIKAVTRDVPIDIKGLWIVKCLESAKSG